MGELGRTIGEEEKQKVVQGEETQEQVEAKEDLKEQTEEKVDEIKDEPKEKKDEGQEKEKLPEKEEVDLVSLFNKEFGDTLGELKEKEQIKALFEKAGKADELESSSKELKQKLEEYKKLSEKVNPLSWFANEDEYIRQQFLKNNKDKLSKESIDVLSSLSPSKVKELSNTDAVKTNLMVDRGLTSEEAEAYMLDRYGVEDFNEELDVAARAKIKADAHDAKQSLSKLYEGIDVPEQIDWETARQQREQSWKPTLEEAVKGIDKIQLDEGIDFVVDDDVKASMQAEAEKILSEHIMNGVEPSEDALMADIGRIKDRAVLDNLDKAMKAYAADKIEAEREKWRKEVHNDTPVDNSERTKTQDTKTADQRLLDAWR